MLEMYMLCCVSVCRCRDCTAFRQPPSWRLENRNVIVDLRAMLLRHAFGNPDDVAALLLLQLQVRVEDAKVELLDEREHVQFHLGSKNTTTKHPL